MKNTLRYARRATVVALCIMLLSFTVAYAFTIIVDGNPADWPPAGPQVTVVADPDEAAIPDDVDFSQVMFTPNPTTLFGRFDTFGTPTRWTPIGISNPFVQICMDVDNNAGTGATIPQCNGQSGVDYILLINGDVSGTPTIALLNCTPGCANQAATLAVATAGNVTEFSVLLSDLGVNGVTCTPSTMIPIVAYFDNQDTPPDDNSPDAGPTTITLQCPTAVKLVSTTAEASSTSPLIPVLAAAAMGLACVGVFGALKLRKK